MDETSIIPSVPVGLVSYRNLVVSSSTIRDDPLSSSSLSSTAINSGSLPNLCATFLSLFDHCAVVCLLSSIAI